MISAFSIYKNHLFKICKVNYCSIGTGIYFAGPNSTVTFKLLNCQKDWYKKIYFILHNIVHIWYGTLMQYISLCLLQRIV